MVLLLANDCDNVIKNKLFFDIQFLKKGFHIYNITRNSQIPQANTKPKKEETYFKKSIG
jgi:hypothetical protein